MRCVCIFTVLIVTITETIHWPGLPFEASVTLINKKLQLLAWHYNIINLINKNENNNILELDCIVGCHIGTDPIFSFTCLCNHVN
jgi:hypothetical protein